MADPAVTSLLPPLYYLSNFRSILDTVSSRYPDLLLACETDWITRFKTLPQPAQALLVRMLSRKGDWFREDKFTYPEIPCIASALDALVSSTLISATTTPDLNMLLELHTKPELIRLFDTLTLKASAKKNEIVEVIVRQADSSPILPYRCITISHDVMPILLLLYFGNARQNLSEFVVNDLGIYQYEKVPLNIKDRLFEKRSQLEAWLSLSTLAEEYWQTVESKQRERVREIVNKLPPLFEWPPLAQKRSRLINAIARDLERLGDTSIAEQLYVQSTMPPARERLARIALSRGEPEKAAKTVATMLNTPYNEDEKDVAERLVKQLAKKGVMTGSANVINTFKEETITLALTKRVELVCADYFVDQGWEVWFSENLVLNALFGLAFWDIIFLPKPGAFLNPFQRGPKDMYLPDFVKAREQEIFARLDALTHDLASILDTYDEKKGIANDWVHWEYIDKALLSAAISSLTPEQCVACFRRILFDPKTNRSGHPDLFMVKEGNCQFVEIKGPGDKLQHHQIRWLNFLNLHGIAANVLYVKQPTSHDA